MNTELFCPGCQQQYSETTNIPLLLTSCGHSICQNCVQSIIKTHQKGECIITCPEDKLTVTLKKKNISQLPKNLVLIKIISKKNEKILKDLGSSFETSEKKKKQSSGDSDMEGLLVDLNDQESSSPLAKQQINRDAKTSQTDSLRDKQQQQKDVEKLPKTQQVVGTKHTKTDICLLHQKPLQIVCIKDLIKICASCAIFGEHKGHQFKSLEEISQQQNKFYTSIIDIMDQKQAITNHICNETDQKQIMSILGKKKQQLVTEINERYKQLYEEVKKSHQQTLLKLNQVIDSAQKKIHQLMKIAPDIFQLCQKWEIQSLRIIRILQGPSQQDIFKMLFKGTDGAGQLLDNGLEIIEKLKLQQQELIPSVQNILDQITLKKSQSIWDEIKVYTTVCDKKQLNISRDHSFLNTLSKFSQKQIENNSRNFAYVDLSESKNLSYDMENQCEDSLLDIDDHSDYSKPQFTPVQDPKKSILDDSILSNGDHKKKKIDSNHSVPVNVNDDKKSKTMVMKKLSGVKSNQASIIGSEKMDKPKKPVKSVRFKLAEKYQKIVDGIKNQTLETVDLTNAQLGDQNIQSISELVKNKTKIKAVKLIRNKLSDNCIKQIIKNFDNIITLNLSQNYLTDTTLDIIAEHIEMLPKLKSLILSQNKIIQRKHKTKIEKLKKLGLTISV